MADIGGCPSFHGALSITMNEGTSHVKSGWSQINSVNGGNGILGGKITQNTSLTSEGLGNPSYSGGIGWGVGLGSFHGVVRTNKLIGGDE